jgi:hypothetical protein
MLVQSQRNALWFGTLEYSQWLPTPLTGAEMSPEAWGSGGTLLNGGGWELSSWGSHKVYTFEWPESMGKEIAQVIKSYSDGTWGRGLIYFQDPLTYTTNVLPARVADPSMALDDEGASLVHGVEPTVTATSGWQNFGLPIQGAYYDLADTDEGFRGVEDAVYVTIPEGYTLFLGAFYDATGSGGIFASPQNANGTIGTAVPLTAKTTADAELLNDAFDGYPGIWIWLGKSAAGAGTVSARGLIARLMRTDLAFASGYGVGGYGKVPYGGVTPQFLQYAYGNWIGGMGNSGCRFSGKPTYVANNGVGGGQVSVAATLREVGSWVYG